MHGRSNIDVDAWQVSVGSEGYQALTRALTEFRRFYETRVCCVVGSADAAVMSLHAFLMSPCVKRFYLDPDTVCGSLFASSLVFRTLSSLET